MSNVDHRLMNPPSLTITKQWKSTSGDVLSLWDLRISQPNISYIPSPTVHSIEHFLGSLLPELSEDVILVAPMGCQTGFYLVTKRLDQFDAMKALVTEAFRRIGNASETPLANTLECGWAENHSLEGAKSVAHWMLSRQADWHINTHPANDFAG